MSTSETRGAITLTGRQLSVRDVVAVASGQQVVRADASGLRRATRAHRILLAAAHTGVPIYGLNVQVGELLAPHAPLNRSNLRHRFRRPSETFNERLLHTHNAGVGPTAGIALVRAAMLIRANTLLLGVAGVQPAAIRLLIDCLNKGIHPILATIGSVGETDVVLMTPIALMLAGKGTVFAGARRTPARAALKEAGLRPVSLFAKDALSLISSNAFSAGVAAHLCHEMKSALASADLVAALSMEAANASVAPLLPSLSRLRRDKHQTRSATRMRNHLKGSFLWSIDPSRALQSPLSFRLASHTHGAALLAIDWLNEGLTNQMNSSDDNPAVVASLSHSMRVRPRVSRAAAGPIVPTGNFDPLRWVLAVEATGTALAHVATLALRRILQLTRVGAQSTAREAAAANVPILQVLDKTAAALSTRIRHLCRPSSLDATASVGLFEDHSTAAASAAMPIRTAVDNFYLLLAVEVICASSLLRPISGTSSRRLGTDTAPLAMAAGRLCSPRRRTRIGDQIGEVALLLKAAPEH